MIKRTITSPRSYQAEFFHRYILQNEHIELNTYIDTYNTPMTLFTMDWNSSSVYSRVGNGTTLMFDGLNFVQGILSFVCNEVESRDGIGSRTSEFDICCCSANIMNESSIC